MQYPGRLDRSILPGLLLAIAATCAGCSGSSEVASEIDAIAPLSGIVTTEVTVTGVAFGTSEGEIIVAGVAAEIIAWADDEVVFAVPLDVYPGDAEVVLTPAKGGASSTTFGVALPRTVYVNEASTMRENRITAFSVAPDGTLTELPDSPFLTGEMAAGYNSDTQSLKIHLPTRRLVASNASTLSVFDIDPVTGELDAVPGSPFAPASSRTYGVTLANAGDRVIAAGFDDQTISVMNWDSDGALSEVSSSPTATSLEPVFPVFSLDDRYVYIPSEASSFEVYSVAPDGALTPFAGNPYGGASGSYGVRMSHDGELLALGGAGIRLYRLDLDTGEPTVVPGSPFIPASPPSGLRTFAFSPDDAQVYASRGPTSSAVYGFDVAADGTLTELQSSPFISPLGANMGPMEISGDGAYIFMGDIATSRVHVYSLSPAGIGAVIAGSPFVSSDGDIPSGMALTF